MKKIILIDGFGLIFKAYYAFMRRPLTNARGENTSAIFGFFKSILSVLQKENPDYYLVALEGEGKCFRKEIYPEYKANRQPPPDDLKAQIPIIMDLLDKLKVPHLHRDEYEADDIIGTVSAQFSATHPDDTIIILSADKDLMQLVGSNVYMYKPDKTPGDYLKLDREKVFESMEVYPEQIIDFLALTGDTADNIPGVSGIGPKSASKLLGEFKSLADIYNRLDEVSSKSVKEKLSGNRENAFLSQKLATIERGLDLGLALSDIQTAPLDLEAGLEVLREADLRSVIDDINNYNKSNFNVALKTQKLSAGTSQELSDIEETYQVVSTKTELDRMIAEINRAGEFCFDLETTGFDFFEDTIICMSLATPLADGKIATYVVPFDLSEFQQKELGIELTEPWVQDIKEGLKQVFTDPGILKIGQNIKFDIKFMRGKCHIETLGELFDTMLAEYCLDASHNVLGMKELAEKYLHFNMIRYTDIVPSKKETLKDISAQLLVKYSGQDAFATYRLYQLLKEKVEVNEQTRDLFYTIEMPLTKVLIDMEYSGVLVNAAYLKNLSAELDKDIGMLYLKMRDLAGGEEFNPNSPIQLREILFTKLGLPVIKTTKTGASTDVDVLQRLALEHDFPNLLLEYRTLSKIKSTYSDQLPEMIKPHTNRIHTTYMQTGTQTGRLSSKDPNLQNIPIKSDVGRRIREAFIPPAGYSIISADYSQIELFLLAEFSKDPMLLEAFQNGEDIHRKTASLIFHTSLDQVTRDQRNIAKAVNFGILYGQSGFSLAEDLNIPVKEASNFIKLYFEKYQGVYNYIEGLKAQTTETGYAKTYWGRIRSIPEIHDKNKMRRAYGERMAVNTTIQGTAADLIKIAMIRIWKTLDQRQLKSNLIMQVHDELIFEAHEAEKEELITIIRDSMEKNFDFTLQLKTSVEWGKNWGELH